MAMIRKVDAEAGGTIIIEAIDDNTCLVKETKVDELKLRVKQLMDEAMGGEALDSDKDSGECHFNIVVVILY